MRVMTFNLRFENDRDGRNAWALRREAVVNIVRKLAPDLLGTQEGTRSQLLYLENHLEGYAMHAPERIWDETCQYPTLFYRKDRFSVQDGAEFWLSPTPSVHRSLGWDSAFPRMLSHGLFRDLGCCGGAVRAAVTHLDNLGKEARVEQAGLIARWLGGRPEASVLLGDFNDDPGSAVHTLLTGAETGLTDTWQALGKSEGLHSMTYHGFLGVPTACRMDWVLASPDFVARDAVLVREHSGDAYPSDHFPYVVDLEWAGALEREPASSPTGIMESE